MSDPLITAAQFLLRNLDWIRHAVGPNAEPFAIGAFREIGDAVSRIRVLVDPGDGPKFLGLCGAVLIDEDPPDDAFAGCPNHGRCIASWDCHAGTCGPVPPPVCDGPVYGYPGADRGTCRTCRTQHDQTDMQARLAGQAAERLADEPLPASQIAYALHLSVNTIRTWGHTSRWDDGTVRRAAKLGTFWRDSDGRIVPWLDPDPSWPAAQRAVYTAGRGPRLHYVGDVRDLATAAAERRAQREAANPVARRRRAD